MRLPYHTALSVTISGILYLVFTSWALALGCLISGIFIDLDHIYDYMSTRGRLHLNVKDFFLHNHRAQYDRIVLILHGWEWVVLLGIAAWLTSWNPWITGLCVGLFQHLIFDAMHNSFNIRSYSLIWRWKKNFHFDTIFYHLKDLKYKHKNTSPEN